MKIHYLLFLSVRNLTAIVRLSIMQKRSIFQNRANKCFYEQNNPFFPTHPPKKKTISPGNSWFAFLSTVSIWGMDSVRFSFPDCFSVLEAVEKKTGGNMRRDAPLSLRPSQVLCYICLQQKFVKFPLQL